MKKVLLCVAAALALSTTSCGVSNQVALNENQIQTDVVLSQKNFRAISTVTGECSQNYIFGFGGLSKKSVGSASLSEMYKKADLMGRPRAVINVSTVYKVQNYAFVYVRVTCISTGTVIEFTE